MIGPLTLLFLSALCQSAEDQMPVTVVRPGDSVTFRCDSELQRIFWYRQPPGRMMQFIHFGFSDSVAESFKDQRFKFSRKEKQFVCTIQNIRKEDEAIYHCILIDGYGTTSVNSTFLVVNDAADSQSCAHVTQSPASASVAPGHSVSLHCSLQAKSKRQIQCPELQQVHWFRSGSVELHTGLTSRFTNSSCVYSLSRTIGRPSEAGTYYCAVHTCGHILFGTGTTLDIDEPVDLQLVIVIAVLSVLLCVCLLVIVVLCVKLCPHCRDSPDSVTTAPYEMSDNVGPSADVNYAALNFSSRKVNRSRDTRGEYECVYSDVQTGLQ